MRKIRTLILLIIVVLVALAFWQYNQHPSEQDETMEAFMKPIRVMQQEVEKRFPQLHDEWEKLQEDIQSHAAELDPKSLSLVSRVFSSSENSTASESVESSTSGKMDFSQEVKKLAEELKRMNASDLAQRLEEFYQQVKQKIAPETHSGA